MTLAKGVCVDGPCLGEVHEIDKPGGPYTFPTPEGSMATYVLTTTRPGVPAVWGDNSFALEELRKDRR